MESTLLPTPQLQECESKTSTGPFRGVREGSVGVGTVRTVTGVGDNTTPDCRAPSTRWLETSVSREPDLIENNGTEGRPT